MNPFLANVWNEFDKLLAKRVTKLFLALSGLLPFAIKILTEKMFITDWMALPSNNINYLILDLFIKGLLPLFCFVAAAELFTGEGERGTLLPIRPISRLELFISKTTSIGIYTMLQLLIGWLGVTMSSIFLDSSYRFADIGLSLAAFVVSWIPLLVLTALAVLLALLVRSSVVAISGLILTYVVMVFLPYVLPGLLYLLPSSYLDWYMQWIGDVSFRWAVQTVTYLFSTAALCLATAYYMFNKREA